VLAGQVPFKNPLLLINPLTASPSFHQKIFIAGKFEKQEFSRKAVEYMMEKESENL